MDGDNAIVQIASASVERNTSKHIVQVGLTKGGIPAWRWISPELWSWQMIDLPYSGRRLTKIAVAMGSVHNTPVAAIAALTRDGDMFWCWLDRPGYGETWSSVSAPVTADDDPIVDVSLTLTVVHTYPHVLLLAQAASGVTHTLAVDEFRPTWTTILNKEVVMPRS